jgi:hypothetical protein
MERLSYFISIIQIYSHRFLMKCLTIRETLLITFMSYYNTICKDLILIYLTIVVDTISIYFIR